MLKKTLLITLFILTAAFVSGCQSSDTADGNDNYIVTTAVPENAREGVKDETQGYIKINPNFDAANIPQKRGKIKKWMKDGLGSKIPGIEEGNILEVINNDNQFLAYIGNTDEKVFQNYYEKLLSNGYKFNQENQSWENFSLNNEQYEINLRFGQDGPNVITIRAKLK